MGSSLIVPLELIRLSIVKTEVSNAERMHSLCMFQLPVLIRAWNMNSRITFELWLYLRIIVVLVLSKSNYNNL